MSPNPKKEGGRERGREGRSSQRPPKTSTQISKEKERAKELEKCRGGEIREAGICHYFLQRAGVPGAPKCTNVIYDTKLANKPTVHGFPWCSGYHIRLTHGRSPVQSRAGT